MWSSSMRRIDRTELCTCLRRWEKPARASRNTPSIASAGKYGCWRLTNSTTAESTFGGGKNACAGTVEQVPSLRIGLHEQGEVAHLARSRADSRRDFALQHHDHALRAKRMRRQTPHHGGCNTVRQVRRHHVWRLTKVWVRIERDGILVHCFDIRMKREGGVQEGHHAGIELHGHYTPRHRRQADGQAAEAGPNLQDLVVVRTLHVLHDTAQHRGVGQHVLAQLAA